jgi:hypothetical protein
MTRRNHLEEEVAGCYESQRRQAMTVRTSTWWTGVRRTLALTVTIAGLVVTAAAMPVQSVRSGARGWATSLSAEERGDYGRADRLAGLPVEYRRALFGELKTAGERAQFWRDVLASYRARHVLTGEQAAVLDRVEVMFTPELFQTRLTTSQSWTVGELRRSVASLLGEAAAQELFQTAGSDSYSAATLPVGERLRYTWRSERSPRLARVLGQIVPSLQAAGCNCNKAANDCYYHQNCGRSPFTCEPSTWGCGWFWMEECDALCSYDP